VRAVDYFANAGPGRIQRQGSLNTQGGGAEAVSKKGLFRILTYCAAIVAIAALFFFFARLDLPSGLLKRGGTVGYFSDGADRGMSVVLQRAGRDAWGFFEWPERGIYGSFSVAEEKGRFKIDIGQGNTVSATLSLPTGNPGKALRIRVETGGAEARPALLMRRGNVPVSRVETYSGAFDAKGIQVSPLRRLTGPSSIGDGGRDPGQSGFFLDALTGSGRPASFLDLSLRRGESPLKYALGYWKRFGRSAAEAAGGNFPLRAFAERQYLIAVSDTLIATATERYVFEGGAHGVTASTFCLIDMENGRVLTAEDLFNDGWREPVGAKLVKEALRVFSSDKGRKKEGSLSGFGLFEDEIEPSSEVFLCRRGVGFHYNRYELGPYAAGDFMFVIPWEDLSGVLKNPDLGESFK